MQPKVSVIIPVYNAEKYLRQCLDSVIKQSLRELEIICVDDGSTDGSREIISEYINRGLPLSYFYQENSGAGIARNKGISEAKGEYILFLDADDWVLPDVLEKIYLQAKKANADVLRCRAYDYDNVTGQVSLSLHNSLKRVPFFLYGHVVTYKKLYWLFPKMTVAPWGGLFRREFLVENGILFNGLKCVNDRSFYWESIIKADRILLSKEWLIYYRQNLKDSLIGIRTKNFECHVESFVLVAAIAKDLPKHMKNNILKAEMRDIMHWANV